MLSRKPKNLFPENDDGELPKFFATPLEIYKITQRREGYHENFWD